MLQQLSEYHKWTRDYCHSQDGLLEAKKKKSKKILLEITDLNIKTIPLQLS